MVFNVQRQSGAFVNTSTKFWRRNGCGQRSADSAWLVDIRDVRTMNPNGARNAIAAAIKRLLFATASRKRLRRTAAGGRRLGAAMAAGAAAAVSGAPPGGPTCAS